MSTFQSLSSRRTGELGEQLGKSLVNKKISIKSIARVFALKGDLGAGKTTFTQGFARGLGIKRRLPSPTFVIMRRYSIPKGKFKHLYHIDAYRLKEADALEAIGLKAILADPTAIVLIEWPERIKKALRGTKMTRIEFRHGKKENERSIIIR